MNTFEVGNRYKDINGNIIEIIGEIKHPTTRCYHYRRISAQPSLLPYSDGFLKHSPFAMGLRPIYGTIR